MASQEEREKQLIRLTSKLPSKKLVKIVTYTMLSFVLFYLNYSLYTADALSQVGVFNFLGMTGYEMQEHNIPRYYITLFALLTVLDIMVILILFVVNGPRISSAITNIWNQFPD